MWILKSWPFIPRCFLCLLVIMQRSEPAPSMPLPPSTPPPTPPRTALWDVTNGVLCLKDCGVCCECSAGQSEVNYLGLNTYFVPLQGWGQDGEKPRSLNASVSRSLWTHRGFFFFKLHVWVVGLYKVLGARPISVRSEVRLQREKKRITFSCFQLKKIKLVVDVLKSVTSRGFNSDSVGSWPTRTG